jgi:4-hydroxythreonine-4-phosphate dehydrogenase
MAIGITMGDVSGVGPELLVRAYAEGALRRPLLAYGDAAAVAYAAQRCNVECPTHILEPGQDLRSDALNLVDAGLLEEADISPGRVSKPAGAAAVAYVERAVRSALSGDIDGIVTLPVNKEACRLTYPDFQGHTELIAGMCGVDEYTMMLAAPDLIVTHVSTHVSLREAIDRVTTARVLTVLRLTHDAVRRIRPRTRIAVAGLNPHAGEHGAFGREEIEQIEPAVQAAVAEGIDAHGPLPPDTLFMQAVNGAYDAIACMYHDQGHIPLKLHGFHQGVNVTVGLPIIRTSVDHGTAFDIAYQGKASTENLVHAFDLAARMAASGE